MLTMEIDEIAIRLHMTYKTPSPHSGTELSGAESPTGIAKQCKTYISSVCLPIKFRILLAAKSFSKYRKTLTAVSVPEKPIK